MEYYDRVRACYSREDNRTFLICLDVVRRQVSSFGDLRPKVDHEDLFGVGVMRLIQFMKERGEGFLAGSIPLIREGIRTSLVDYLRKELGRKNIYDWVQEYPLKKRVSSSPRYIHQRRQVSLDVCDEIADTRPSSDTLHSILEQERNDVIQNALEHLQPLDREFVRLYYFERKDMHNIAELFGITHVTVLRHLVAAREKMRHYLRNYHFCPAPK